MLKKIVLIGLINLFLVGGTSCGGIISETLSPTSTSTEEIGTNSDNLIPLGTAFRSEAENVGLEMTILEFWVKKEPVEVYEGTRKRVWITVKVKSITTGLGETGHFSPSDLQVIGSKNVFSSLGGPVPPPIPSGETVTLNLFTYVLLDDSNFFLRWTPWGGLAGEERFFALE